MRKISIRWMAALCLLLMLFCSCGQEVFAEYTLDGGILCRVFGSESGLRRLEVTNAEGEMMRFSLPRSSLEPDPTGGLTLIDLNFDGHLDVQIAYKKMANGDMRYTCFLWSETGLAESEALSALRNLELDAEGERLLAREHYILAEEYESNARVAYVWQDGALCAVQKRELIYYLEEEVYCVRDYAAEAGEDLTMVDERWIFPRSFDETEIWN